MFSSLAAIAAEQFGGRPPFALTDLDPYELVLTNCPLPIDTATAVSWCKNSTADVASQIVTLLEDPDAVAAVFDADKRVTVRLGCVESGKLDTERQRVLLNDRVTANRAADALSVVKSMDLGLLVERLQHDSELLATLTDFGPVRRRLHAALDADVDTLQCARALLAIRPNRMQGWVALRQLIVEKLLTDKPNGETDDSDAKVRMAVRLIHLAAKGRVPDELVNVAVEQVLASTSPETWEHALNHDRTFPRVLRKALDGDGPLTADEAVAAAVGNARTFSPRYRDVGASVFQSDCNITPVMLLPLNEMQPQPAIRDPQQFKALRGRLTDESVHVIRREKLQHLKLLLWRHPLLDDTQRRELEKQVLGSPSESALYRREYVGNLDGPELERMLKARQSLARTLVRYASELHRPDEFDDVDEVVLSDDGRRLGLEQVAKQAVAFAIRTPVLHESVIALPAGQLNDEQLLELAERGGLLQMVRHACYPRSAPATGQFIELFGESAAANIDWVLAETLAQMLDPQASPHVVSMASALVGLGADAHPVELSRLTVDTLRKYPHAQVQRLSVICDRVAFPSPRPMRALDGLLVSMARQRFADNTLAWQQLFALDATFEGPFVSLLDTIEALVALDAA